MEYYKNVESLGSAREIEVFDDLDKYDKNE
jgi:hypothetical protein